MNTIWRSISAVILIPTCLYARDPGLETLRAIDEANRRMDSGLRAPCATCDAHSAGNRLQGPFKSDGVSFYKFNAGRPFSSAEAAAIAFVDFVRALHGSPDFFGRRLRIRGAPGRARPHLPGRIGRASPSL